MNLINSTKLAAGYTTSTDKSGRESIVVVAKGTFAIPADPDRPPELLAEQVPLVTCDVFTAEPGFSSPLYEIDFAPPKPRCDVVLNGRAYAPDGRPVERVGVGLRVGDMTKTFSVVGHRTWAKGLLRVGATRPEPFVIMPFSYDNAFGGTDNFHPNPAKHRTYPENHVGKGFHDQTAADLIDGKPLPNTEEDAEPVASPRGKYRPMAFGPLGRAWQQRIKWAGTYDEKWQEEQFPFLPEDFDNRYFQCSPEDQQVDHPRGGEEVVLVNLTPEGRTAFRLPGDLALPVVFLARDGRLTEVPAVADTLMIEPDRKRFMIVWRASFVIRRTIREVNLIAVGHTADQMEQANRTSGKRRFKSLAELVHWSRGTDVPLDTV